MISKQYATGLALLVMSVCSRGPIWLDLIVGVVGAVMVWTDKEAGRG